MMTGEELRDLVWGKWGRSYDVQLRQIKGEMYFQVMWKYLEQVSFPLSEADYLGQLGTIADYLTVWGYTGQVVAYLEEVKDRPRVGKAISLRLQK